MFGFWGKFPVGPNAAMGNKGGVPESFGIEPLEGFRSWNIAVSSIPDKGYVLKSLHMAHEWDLDNTARCGYSRNIHPDDISPSFSCSCGFYAQIDHNPIKEWEDQRRGHISAQGVIKMHGRIIRCERGYKAQYVSLTSPIVLETTCGGWVEPEEGTKYRCPNPPVFALPTGYRFRHYAKVDTVCEEHLPKANPDLIIPEGQELRMDIKVTLNEVIRQLETNYPGIEFMSWLDWETQLEELLD